MIQFNKEVKLSSGVTITYDGTYSDNTLRVETKAIKGAAELTLELKTVLSDADVITVEDLEDCALMLGMILGQAGDVLTKD